MSAGRGPRAALIAMLVGVTLSLSAQPAFTASGGGPDVLNAEPPGESGLFTPAGQAAGTLANPGSVGGSGDSANPGAFGAHVDDQRQMFWDFKY
jgi:hypothetical protein